MADTAISFDFLALWLEKVAEERCDADEIFMDGKPFLGGANHYADDPTTKQPLLKLAMG